MYQFSLKSFSVVFDIAIQRAVMDDEVAIRVKNLIESITYQVFKYNNLGVCPWNVMVTMDCNLINSDNEK